MRNLIVAVLMAPRACGFVSTTEFAQARASEIKSLVNEIVVKRSNKLESQTMPVHLRRRASSRKYNQLNKRKTVKKVSKRKYNRLRARHHLKTKHRKQSKSQLYRLTTNDYFSKRFHMVSWYGCRLPFCSTTKNYRMTYKALERSCVVQDISYYSLLSLSLSPEEKNRLFGRHLRFTNSEQPLSSSTVCDKTVLFVHDDRVSPIFVAPVIVSVFEGSCHTCSVLLWCHPLARGSIVECFRALGHECRVINSVSRLRLVGPLSVLAAVNVFELADCTDGCVKSLWSLASRVLLSPADLPLNLALAFSAVPTSGGGTHGSLFHLAQRLVQSEPDSSPSEAAKLQRLLRSLCEMDMRGTYSQLLSGWSEESKSYPVALVVKNEVGCLPSVLDSAKYLSHGVDLIFPFEFAPKLLRSFVVCGVQIGGLRETLVLARECMLPSFPVDYPEMEWPSSAEQCQNISKRKVLRRIKAARDSELNIRPKLIGIRRLSPDAGCQAQSQQHHLRISRQMSESDAVGPVSSAEFIFVGVVMCGRGVPQPLGEIYMHKEESGPQAEDALRKATDNEDYVLIGYLTDGDMSLRIGRGIGKGFVSCVAYRQLCPDVSGTKRVYVKNPDGKKFWQCDLVPREGICF